MLKLVRWCDGQMVRWLGTVVLISLFFSACAKRGVENATPMILETITFKALAYVVAEKHGVKWADNVSVIVKTPGGLRLSAFERITDVVATMVARNGNGHLAITSTGKKYPLKDGQAMLPKIGEISVSTDLLANLLIGRPTPNGAAQVSESFHADKGSYFINSASEEIEMSSLESMPLVYTKYEDSGRKRIAIEADFADFISVGGKKFPQHVVIRIEHPKLVIDVRYKDIQTDANVPWRMFE